mmetsp:Transcript_1073/g.2388  ORF Transcript_1073/g.2388 Transcript_1073/m.2388 type:complete len:281 (+) Transcript_1073:627-1469(+)
MRLLHQRLVLLQSLDLPRRLLEIPLVQLHQALQTLNLLREGARFLHKRPLRGAERLHIGGRLLLHQHRLPPQGRDQHRSLLGSRTGGGQLHLQGVDLLPGLGPQRLLLRRLALQLSLQIPRLLRDQVLLVQGFRELVLRGQLGCLQIPQRGGGVAQACLQKNQLCGLGFKLVPQPVALVRPPPHTVVQVVIRGRQVAHHAVALGQLGSALVGFALEGGELHRILVQEGLQRGGLGIVRVLVHHHDVVLFLQGEVALLQVVETLLRVHVHGCFGSVCSGAG